MPLAIHPEMHVAAILLDDPSRAEVFEQLRIDYCCGGKKPLAEACAKRGLDVDAVIDRLVACEPRNAADPSADWIGRSCVDLISHIVTDHHGYVRHALPRLLQHGNKVAKVHGEEIPQLVSLAQVIAAMAEELFSHMEKEEQMLFPYIERLERGQDTPFPTIGAPISCMEHEHSDAGEALERIRELTNNHTPPMYACNTWRVLYHSLAEFERDLHAHIHKENNILFPRAMAMEATVRGTAETRYTG